MRGIRDKLAGIIIRFSARVGEWDIPELIYRFGSWIEPGCDDPYADQFKDTNLAPPTMKISDAELEKVFPPKTNWGSTARPIK